MYNCFSYNFTTNFNMLTSGVFVMGMTSLFHFNSLRKKGSHFYLKTQFVSRRKHFPSQLYKQVS